MEYEPDGDMIFNYLMVSALAAATDFIEKEGLKPSGGKLLKIKYYREISHSFYPTFCSKFV